MSELALIVVAVIAAVASVVAAVIATRASRVTRLETLVDESTEDRHLLYLWNRQLVDHIYRGLSPPPPPPPVGLFKNGTS